VITTSGARQRWDRQVAWAHGLSAASCSLAGDVRTGLSGDWCDLRVLADGRVALFVGDAMGQGPRAAAVAKAVRSAVRALVEDRTEPALLLSRLDEVAARLDAGMVTMLMTLVNPRRAEVEVFSAGHPPPLVVSGPGAAAYVDLVARPPLGTGFGGPVPVTRRRIPAGSTVIAFTDGLVERRGWGLDERMEAIRSAAADLYGRGPENVCDVLAEAELGGPGPHDDAAVLVARLSRPGAALG
jgi:serine phosphatase RsbU (regulator of sigma subunit)